MSEKSTKGLQLRKAHSGETKVDGSNTIVVMQEQPSFWEPALTVVAATHMAQERSSVMNGTPLLSLTQRLTSRIKARPCQIRVMVGRGEEHCQFLTIGLSHPNIPACGAATGQVCYPQLLRG